MIVIVFRRPPAVTTEGCIGNCEKYSRFHSMGVQDRRSAGRPPERQYIYAVLISVTTLVLLVNKRRRDSTCTAVAARISNGLARASHTIKARNTIINTVVMLTL